MTSNGKQSLPMQGKTVICTIERDKQLTCYRQKKFIPDK